MQRRRHKVVTGRTPWKTLRRPFSLIVVVMLLTITAVIFVPRPAAAQSDYPIEYGWIGWNGNSVIYPTKDSTMTYLPSVSQASAEKGAPSANVPLNNSITVGLWNETSGGQDYGVAYGWLGDPTDLFEILAPYWAVGGFNFSGESKTNGIPGSVYDIGALNNSVSITGVGDKSSILQIKPGGQYKGENATFGGKNSPGGGNAAWLEPVIDTGFEIAGAAGCAATGGAGCPISIGVSIAAASIMNAWAGYLGAYNYKSSTINDISNINYTGANPHIVIWGATQNGSYATQKCVWVANQWATCGQDVASNSFVAWTTIGYPADITPGAFTVSATDQFWAGTSTSGAVPYTVTNGASAELSYNVEPAVSIGGYAYMWPGGPPAPNAVLDLQQNPPAGGGEGTDIEIYTNSSGYWHFFAEPGATYGGSTVTYNNGLGSDSTTLNVPSTSTSVTGQNLWANTSFGNVGELKGSVKSSTGSGIAGASLSLTNTANSLETSTVANSAGAYSGPFYYPTSNGINSFSLVASAPGYCPSSTPLINLQPGKLVTENFVLDPGCGGGGGCVTFGTPILTPGGYLAVQRLGPGSTVVEFNLSSGKLTTGTLISANATAVRDVEDVNHGALYLTPMDQPMFIRNASFEGWLRDPQNLTTADQLFDPVTGAWVNVTSVVLIAEHVNVYDVVTTHLDDFIANGYLLDLKKGS